MDDATPNVPLGSGHTIWSRHIEEPKKRFVIEFDSASYVNVLHFADKIAASFVLAETPEGALAIAQHHHGIRGSNFAVVGNASVNNKQNPKSDRSRRRLSPNTGVTVENQGGSCR